MRATFKSKKIPTTITGKSYLKTGELPKRKELEESVITEATKKSPAEIIKQDEMMFTEMEPKVARRFIVKITNIHGHQVIPSYCIKSIERPEFVKSFFGYKLLPTTLTCYEPVSPMIEESIQFYVERNVPWNVEIKLLGPIGDVVEEWHLTETKILRVKYSKLDWCDSNPVEVSIQIQAKKAKLITTK